MDFLDLVNHNREREHQRTKDRSNKRFGIAVVAIIAAAVSKIGR